MSIIFQSTKIEKFKILAKINGLETNTIDYCFDKKETTSNESDLLEINFFSFLNKCSFEELIETFHGLYDPLLTNTIPQFSNFDLAINRLIRHIICMFPHGIDYKIAGLNLLDPSRKKYALVKYGENHLKILTLLGLIYFNKNDSLFYCNNLTCLFNNLNQLSKKEITARLILTIPLMAKILFLANSTEVNVSQLIGSLSSSTITRRNTNIFFLINYCLGFFEEKKFLLNNIKR